LGDSHEKREVKRESFLRLQGTSSPGTTNHGNENSATAKKGSRKGKTEAQREKENRGILILGRGDHKNFFTKILSSRSDVPATSQDSQYSLKRKRLPGQAQKTKSKKGGGERQENGKRRHTITNQKKEKTR